MKTPPKYPRTPHWITSPGVGDDDKITQHPEMFIGREVVITEKLDGSNTCLFNGKVFARSTGHESNHGWHGMTKKHHAWKVNNPDACVYGEDIFGVHSIEYGPVKESETFYMFASRFGIDDGSDDWFADWDLVEEHAAELNVKTVPVVFRGKFASIEEISRFFAENINTPSVLGGEKEGFVIRDANSFNALDFSRHVCKYVRENHVKTDEHWTRNWKTCNLKG